MDDLERYRRRQAKKWQQLRLLGVRNVRCICGETDPLCFEVDHLERRKNSDTLWGTCKNCRAKITARQITEHPEVGIDPGNPLERMAHAAFGASAYLEFISSSFWEIGEALIKLTKQGVKLDG